MRILSVALFGSQARGDHTPTSDTDLLLITSEPRPKHASVNHTSLSFYPAKYLREKARNGDLFVCHLVKEAKILFDEENTFEKIKHEFRLRDSYATEVKQASELGWFLIRYAKDFEDVNTANRRIAWCVRTILIAHTAEARKPVFSAKALAKFAKTPVVAGLIDCKTSNTINKRLLSHFTNFLDTWGSGDIRSTDKSPLKYFQHFQKTTNKVALQTYRHGWTIADEIYV